MSKIPESSKLTLYSGVGITTGLQVVFKSVANQAAYFNSKKKFNNIMTNRKFSYLRNSGTVKIELSTAQAQQCDYMSFINPAFENKTFYAKILSWKYISNKVTEISYAVDMFQTYMFDVDYEFGMIEREHLSQTDFTKAETNPFDPDIYEFQTAENLQVSKEMERYYTIAMSNMVDFPQRGGASVACFEISDFDFDDFPTIQSDFLDKFDMSISSTGEVRRNGAVTGSIDIKVARGYGIYALYIGGSKYNNIESILNWMSAQGLTDNIIGIFQCGRVMWDVYSGENETTLNNRRLLFNMAPPKYDVQNKKLLLSPFQYLRVLNNEGDIKEYKYELFGDLQVGDSSFNMAFIPLFDGAPMTTFVPINYRKAGWNTEERIDCKQFPQIGYTTDAYLSFISSQMISAIGSKTATAEEGLNQLAQEGVYAVRNDDINNAYSSSWNNNHTYHGLEGLGDAIWDLGIMSGITPAAIEGIGALAGGTFNKSPNPLKWDTETYGQDLYSYRSGGELPTQYFKYAKSAYSADVYHAGATNGTLGYYMPENRPAGTYTIIAVKLKEEILKIYDNYFSLYGYSSGRIGIPRVCNYITGGSDVPHFATYNGDNITYVKTSNMHVTHTLGYVSDSIENMFNSGIIFMKGD